jgi:hypothetical protein
MKFEWDETKNQQNIAKHGVQFQDACRIFDGFTVDAVDNRTDYGEERIISIGLLDGIAVLTVIHTDRKGVYRIISARPANRKERKCYDEEIQKAFNP